MKRRKAREYILQFLYAIDLTQASVSEKCDDLKVKLKTFWKENQEKDSEIIAFAEDIILGTLANCQRIDSIIQTTATHWSIFRMAAIDRNILRFATYEILYRKDIPPAVTINEAIEIAKAYSSSESASFINGILDKICKEKISNN